ncbi:MAG: WD40/YVTN/BNR-like repeat-containing protein [Saprospiraceae bacterium]
MVSLYKSVSTLLFACLVSLSLTAQVKDTWQNLSGNYLALTHAPDNPQHLFAAAVDGHILTSRDDGATWASSGLQSGFVDDPVTGLAAIGGDTLLATTSFESNAFWRSTNGGESWTKIETSISIQGQSRAQYVAPQVAILGGNQNGTTTITRDGGLSIDTIQREGYYLFSGGDGILMGVQTTGSSAQVIRSTSFGESWEIVTTAATVNTSIRILNGYTIHIKDADHFAISANKEADVLFTSDGGLSFNGTTIPGRDIKKIVWQSDTELVSYDESFGAALSTDGGLTWAVDTDITPATNRTAIHATAHLTPSGTNVVATLNEIYTRTAGTADWNLSRGHIEPTRVQAIEVADKQTAYLRFNNTGRPEYSPAYVTTNGGTNWRTLEGSGLPIHAQPNGVVFASRNTKIDRSTDYGETWTEVYGGVGFTPVFEMIAPNDDLLIAVTASGFLHSFDDGITWEIQYATDYGHSSGINSIAVIDAATYVVSSGFDNSFKINITRDTGRTFLPFNSTTVPGRTTGHVAAASGRLFLTPNLMSTDLGDTWERLDDRDTFGTKQYERVYFRTESEGFFSEDSGSGFVAYTESAGDRFEETRTGSFGIGSGVKSMGFADEDRTAGFAAGINIFRYADDAWPVLQATLNGTSSSREISNSSLGSVWPNPVTAGSELHFDQTDQHTSNLLLVSPIGRVVTPLRIADSKCTLPQNLPTGLYTLIDTERGNSARILISNN